MKNQSKLVKVLTLIVSLVLLFSAVCLVVGAQEDDYTGNIEYLNIQYGDTIAVLIAVDASTADSKSVSVMYVDAYGVEREAKFYQNMEIDGVIYPVYYTAGIAAKDLGQYISVTVYKDGQATDSKQISVAQYLYARLYRDGFINATEGKDLNKKNLYLKHLEYAACAEQSLWNDKDENANAQRTLVTDKVYVYANGVVLDKNVYEKSEAITLTYTGTAPEGYIFNGKWSSTVGGESVVNDGEAFYPTVHAVYAPCFEAAALSYYDSANAGTRFNFDDGNKPSSVVMNSAGGTNPATVSVKADENENYVLYDNNTKKNFGYALTTGDSNKYSAGKYVFEADVCFDAVSNVSGGSLYGGLLGEFYYNGETTPTTRNNGGICYNAVTYIDESTYTWFGQTLNIGTTYKIALVYDIETNKCSVYVDNIFVAEDSFTRTNTDDSVFYGVFFLSRQAGGCKYSLDNVYLGVIDGVIAE